jgi:DedD protein
MASNASPEASEIRRRGRRRLIGAVALVLLLVVFVPMVLDSEPRPARNEPVVAIPPRDNAPALPPPKAAVVEAVKTPPATEAPAPAKPPAAPQAKAAEPMTRLQGFAVQVGAFRDEGKLKQSREKLAAAGIVHYTERLDSKAGPLTRLRAGPFATRQEAEAALAKLKRSTLDGKVVPLP